ncbi:MAG: acyl carrier protein [Defluviitaleaceae bacterium]|nr:acyl carrier protein [Defluviitaleaceae bacterium]
MVFEKIRDIIAEQTGKPKNTITKETRFAEDLNADSLDIFQTITELEEIFGMEFSDEAMESIKTVGDAVAYIEKLV